MLGTNSQTGKTQDALKHCAGETTMKAVIFADANGKPLDMLSAAPKTFKTGSIGYYAGGKIVLDGERYQVSVSVVKVGSKPQE
jgi:hypothetical protein